MLLPPAGHLEVVRQLVSQGAEISCKDKRGYTPLHAAASSGQLAVVKHLLNLAVEVRTDRQSRLTGFLQIKLFQSVFQFIVTEFHPFTINKKPLLNTKLWIFTSSTSDVN